MSDRELMQYLYNINAEQDLSQIVFSVFCKIEKTENAARYTIAKLKKSKWQVVSRVDLV